MIISRLSTKGQTTIPQPVRAALRLRKGDDIAYTIGDGHVVLTRAPAAASAETPVASFAEWSTSADAEAYAKL